MRPDGAVSREDSERPEAEHAATVGMTWFLRAPGVAHGSRNETFPG